MNVGVIARNIGIALIFNALFMFFSLLVSAFNGFDSSFSPLFLSAVITFVFGSFPLIFVKNKNDINTKEGLAIILFSWILSCIFGMIPYVLWGGEFTLANAWFESSSGITTTGATIVNDIEALPKGLLFWRSSTHFIGGLGVVVFMMMILPSLGSIKLRMRQMEISDVSKSNYRYKSNQLIKVVFSVYIGLTISLIILLLCSGMSLFDAVNHAFSTVSTGGFSTRNLSIAAFNSPLIETILMIYMILSSLHFGLIYSSIASRSAKIFRDPVTKFYLTTILIAGLLVTINLRYTGTYDNIWLSLRESFFYVTSVISATGFAIDDTSVWPVFSILILLYISIQCGCSGSTTGGVKSDRVWILFKAARAQLMKIAHPNAVVTVKSGGRIIERDMILNVALFVLVYLFVILIGSMIYAACGLELMESLSSSVALMCNIGPAFGSVGSLDNFSQVPSFAKIVMGIQMIVGRLGVFSVLIIFTIFRRNN
ncbi:MAG: TrkH family potassium uptake protein [Bacteroidales bacterium]|nr:TrkH family potassium uptake protein [Bacteroidales bacterium]MDD4670194.1 TrkH family potassium uptake protein [Bacteroidales bacterium]